MCIAARSRVNSSLCVRPKTLLRTKKKKKKFRAYRVLLLLLSSSCCCGPALTGEYTPRLSGNVPRGAPHVFPEWLLCWAQGEKNASLQVFGSVDRGEVCTRQAADLDPTIPHKPAEGQT
jgi:hypothetical protein